MTSDRNLKRKPDKVSGKRNIEQPRIAQAFALLKDKSVWAEQMQQLVSRHFDNENQALTFLVQSVLEKLQLKDDKDTHEFVFDLLKYDPDIMHVLKTLIENNRRS